MMVWTKKHYMISALLLLLASNLFVLTGVAYNRSGEPLSKITLTERELSMPYGYYIRKEDSGLQFHLNWRVYTERDSYSSYGYYNGRYTTVDWLDAKKLQQLGFDISYALEDKNASRIYRNMSERETFLVLEYDGKTYQRALKKAQDNLFAQETLLEEMPAEEKKRIENKIKEARKRLEQEQNSRSRLYVIDAGLDADALREKYAEQKHYFVLKGKVKIFLDSSGGEKKLRGRISGVLNNRVHVPLPFKDSLADLTQKKNFRHYQADKPRFKTELAWGKRYEPWMVSVARIE